MRVRIVGSWIERVLVSLAELRQGGTTTDSSQQSADIDWTRRTYMPFN